MNSALEEYGRNYGEKLRTALGVGPTMGSALNPMGQDPIVSREPGGTADMGGGDMGGPMASPAGSELDGDPEAPGSALEPGGVTFRDTFKAAPEHVQTQELSKLEQSLKQGNQTIDSAYDDMVKQLGAPPDRDRKLSRKEKGMLLMEFGLKMLANSRKGLATAAGQAGAETLGSYQGMKEGPAAQYQQSRSLIEAARTKDKATLARQSALESVKTPAGQQSRLPGKFTGDDGFLYFYDENGTAKKALDESGKPIKAQESGGASGRGFESDAKYERYMEIYGQDPNTGEPLSGLQLQQVKQDALDFANDRGASIDDLDLDIAAENSADKEMGADAYRDMTPEQREAKRNEIATSRRGRLRRPTRSHLAPPGGGHGEPSRGRQGRRTGKSFATEADAQAAIQRGEIRSGDIVKIGGRDAEVD